MIDFGKELSKYNLTNEEYENCIKDVKDKMMGLNDYDWGDIVNKYNLGIHYDSLRKASTSIFGGAFVSEYMKSKEAEQGGVGTNGYLAELKETKRELLKEKQKVRDEKIEYNRWLREEARDELICERICDEIRRLPDLAGTKASNSSVVKIGEALTQKEKEYILCLADEHYGTEFEIKGLRGEVLNKYSPEIFEERMCELLAQVIVKVKKENVDTLNIFSLGDSLDGILRVSQISKLRYGIVESTIKYSELICNWLSKLTEFVKIKYYSTEGNHTELRMIGEPKGTFKQDNMQKVVNVFIKERMRSNPNFEFIENPTGLIYGELCGSKVLAIHGEVKDLETAMQDFTNMYNTQIDIVIAGHKHHYRSETVGVNRDVITVPSIIGIDDFSVSLGRTANAGAMFITLEANKGITEQTTFKFSA